MRTYLICLVLILLQIPLSAQNNRDAAWNYQTGRDLENRNRMGEADFYYNEAVRITTDEISRNAATRNTYTVLTWTLQRQRKYQDVITWGERGLRLFTDEYRILETMGEAYFYLNNYDESLRFMQRYANSVPQGDRTSIAYFFIGEIYRQKNLLHHADIAYSTALRLNPYSALWWYRLGLVREAMKDYPLAINAYEQVIRLNPDNQEARINLNRIHLLIGP
jgi:tetratricopeptide (TPR) repeat protein